MDKSRKALLAKIRAANQHITKAQRDTLRLWSLDFVSASTFYQIISGCYLSEKNIPFADAILKRMEKFEKTNRQLFMA